MAEIDERYKRGKISKVPGYSNKIYTQNLTNQLLNKFLYLYFLTTLDRKNQNQSEGVHTSFDSDFIL